jgi:hypothetical protein
MVEIRIFVIVGIVERNENEKVAVSERNKTEKVKVTYESRCPLNQLSSKLYLDLDMYECKECADVAGVVSTGRGKQMGDRERD